MSHAPPPILRLPFINVPVPLAPVLNRIAPTLILRWGDRQISRGQRLDLVFSKTAGKVDFDTLKFLIESRPFSLDFTKWSQGIKSTLPQTVTLTVTALRGGPLNILTHQFYFTDNAKYTLKFATTKGTVSEKAADKKESARNDRLISREEDVKVAREIKEIARTVQDRITRPTTAIKIGTVVIVGILAAGFFLRGRLKKIL